MSGGGVDPTRSSTASSTTPTAWSSPATACAELLDAGPLTPTTTPESLTQPVDTTVHDREEPPSAITGIRILRQGRGGLPPISVDADELTCQLPLNGLEICWEANGLYEDCSRHDGFDLTVIARAGQKRLTWRWWELAWPRNHLLVGLVVRLATPIADSRRFRFSQACKVDAAACAAARPD